MPATVEAGPAYIPPAWAPDRGPKVSTPDAPKVKHFSIDEIIRRTSDASLSNPNALTLNPNRRAIESLRAGIKLANQAPKGDVYPRFEYASQPRAEGMTVQGDTKTLHIAESVLNGLPFVERHLSEQIDQSQTGIGLGGQRERHIVLNGNAREVTSQFYVSPDTITRVDSPTPKTSETSGSQAAA